MHLFIGAATDLGQRSNNEDYYCTVDGKSHGLRADGIVVAADGMGGRNCGEKASETAVRTVEETLVKLLTVNDEPPVSVHEALGEAVLLANARVWAVSQEDEAYSGMGTTCVIAVVEGEHLHVAHVGDSRAYLLRESWLEQLTYDHSYVAEQVRLGEISKAGARKSPFKNVITRAIGIEPTVIPDLYDCDLDGARSLLLCTDGLTNMVTDDEIAQALAYAPTAQEAADLLVSSASQAGGQDNITAIVVRFREDAPMPTPSDSHEAESQREQGAARPQFLATLARILGRSLLPLIAALLVIFILLVVAFSFGSLLAQEGYQFQPTPPFAAKPPGYRVRSVVSLNPAHVTYDTPHVLLNTPVRSDTLLLARPNGTLHVISAQGEKMTVSIRGQIISRYPLFQANVPLDVKSRLHTAVDPYGDLYIADAGARTITKLSPSGETLAEISENLTDPRALAVAGDGTIYVVDAGRITVIRAQSHVP